MTSHTSNLFLKFSVKYLFKMQEKMADKYIHHQLQKYVFKVNKTNETLKINLTDEMSQFYFLYKFHGYRYLILFIDVDA